MTFSLERRGSSKDIWKILGNNNEVTDVYFVFTNRVSVFDIGPIPMSFTGLGQLRCAIAGKIFKVLESQGFGTHYLSHDTATGRMNVKPVNIPALTPPVDYGASAKGIILPVELLCRLSLTDKFMARVERGEIDRQQVERLIAFGDWRNGSRIDQPFIECSTKFETADRYLSDSEAVEVIAETLTIPVPFRKTGRDWLIDYCYHDVKHLFWFLYQFFKSAGFQLIDGKVEAALTSYNHIMFVDSISPDELRLVGPDGRSYDKDPVREWYQKTFPDWYAELLIAKKTFPADKTQWPQYPDVPPQPVIDDMVDRYQSVAEAIGAI